MITKNKELLIRDLSARLPYGVKAFINIEDSSTNIYASFNDIIVSIDLTNDIANGEYSIADIKPYLFPMSSMTKEQKIEYARLWEDYSDKHFDAAFSGDVNYDIDMYKLPVDYHVIDYLNAHHFDYRGLIDKGLAIDATNLNIY